MAGDNTPVDGSSSSEGELPDDDSPGPDSPGPDSPVPADAVTLAPPVTPTSATSTGVNPPAPISFETPGVLAAPPDYSQAGVPSLDFVRDKIEGRYAKSLGSTELAQETPEARSFDEQATKRADAAKEKLDAIRRSLRGDPSS